KVGEIIEARRVIWGDYQRHGREWRINIHLLNVATGEELVRNYSISSNWFALQEEPTEEILKCLAVRPSSTERTRMRRECSPNVLEWVSKGHFLMEKHAPWPQLVEIGRRAITADTRSEEHTS